MKSTEFFKGFYNFAKKLEDKVGMGFALNRVSCGLYYQGKFREAVSQNERCMELMDEENIYAAYYNSGIFYRKMGQHKTALDLFGQVDLSHARPSSGLRPVKTEKASA